jgi:ABC-2 type transport system permease protein
MREQALAIVWAQWRSARNYFPKSDYATVLTVVIGVLWYGLWCFGAVSVGLLCAESEPPLLAKLLPAGLLLAMLYWQLIPILMASTGHSLELRKLVVYPIPHSELFGLEVLLRVTTAIEMILMVLGALAGLLFNRHVPFWAPPTLLLFVVFNLFLSAGLRDMLGRIMARKRIREIMVFVFVLFAALPQLLLRGGSPGRFRLLLSLNPSAVWPWVAAAHLALNSAPAIALASILCWAAAAYYFGRWQFERNLRFDVDEAGASPTRADSKYGIGEKLFQLPSLIFGGQLGALIEKEIRFLTRAPRFRLVFLMGFSFGLIIWLPLTLRAKDHSGITQNHYLTAVAVYALMLLGEVCIWNVFGFDRSAVQVYFAMPVKMSTVLAAKNITASFFILLETAIIALVCFALRLPMTLAMIVEAVCVVTVLAVYLLAIGNMISTRNPRAVDPSQSWRRTSAGRVQAFLLFIYLLVSTPIALAFGARYAFESELAFYAVLAVDLLIGAVVYWIAMESALTVAQQRKEAIIATLSQSEGPVA